MNADARHRLAWRTLDAVRHQYRCTQCGAEPIVTLDENHDPRLACRMHSEATIEERA